MVRTTVPRKRADAAARPSEVVAALLAALLFPLVAGGASAQPAARLEAHVDSVARAAMKAWGVPGMTVVVMRGARTVVAKGYGVADAARGTGATPATVYQLGSISKQLTAAGVMRLVERGQVRLDAPVSTYLPEYRPVGDSMLVKHLLHQASGIAEEFMLAGYDAGIADTTRPNAELLALVMRQPLGFAPGSRWSYSNSNYALLAAVIERVTGQPYERVLADELFVPLGLTSMRHCTPLPSGPDDARGHVREGDRTVPSPPENMHWIRGDGGICASAVDLARWSRALAMGDAVRMASWQRMTSSERLADGTTPAYGYGVSLVPLDGRHRRISHGGRMAGFTGTVAHYAVADVTIAILANVSGLWIESLEHAIAREALGVPAPSPRAVRLRPRDARAWAGTYDVGVVGMPVEVRYDARSNRLRLDWPGPGPKSWLLPRAGRAFVAETAPDAVSVRFAAPDASGRAPAVVILMAGMEWYGRRVR
jgi:D-alanyl-D-alanine carboxypeptidase